MSYIELESSNQTLLVLSDQFIGISEFMDIL